VSHVHKFTKHIASEDEQLPDSTGAVITYVSAPKGDFETTERFAGGAATVQCGVSFTAPDGTAGTIVDQSLDLQYGKTQGGVGPIQEIVTKCRVDLGAGVTSF
jgi:hypothetical protein